jgi:hypothetical protein
MIMENLINIELAFELKMHSLAFVHGNRSPDGVLVLFHARI